MTVKTDRDIQTRCYNLCGLSEPCFTRDQINCICDIVINKVASVKVIMQNAQLLCDNVEDMCNYLLLANDSIDDLITWCKKIERKNGDRHREDHL